MIRLIIAFICELLFLIHCACAFGQIVIAPTNPEFVKYNRTVKLDSGSYNFTGAISGIIPVPVSAHFSKERYQKNNALKQSEISNYDLREEGYITSVKNQGSCGSCWMFTTMGAIESNWLLRGYGEYDLSEQNLKNCYADGMDGCLGGNHRFATAYLSRGDGPVAEADDIYNVTTKNCNESAAAIAYIPEAVYIPSDLNIIQQSIIDYGGLYTTMHFDAQYYNPDGKHSYCYTGEEIVNHGVLLAGWNDTMVTACGTGAWICKNSYGTNWGDNGYFYISYMDTKILSTNAAYPLKEEALVNKTIFQYDTLGWISNVGYDNILAYGLIKFTADDNQEIVRIGTYTNTENSIVSGEVFLNKDDDILYNFLGSFDEQYKGLPGYYWFNLNHPVKIKAGESFYLKIKYQTPGYHYPIPLEVKYENYANPGISKGVCWISQYGLSWDALGSDIPGYEMDLCIKAMGEIYIPDSINSGPSRVMISPNPCTDFINIEFNNLIGKDFTLQLISTKGQICLTREFTTADTQFFERLQLNQLSKGLYILKVTGDIENESLNIRRLIKL